MAFNKPKLKRLARIGQRSMGLDDTRLFAHEIYPEAPRNRADRRAAAHEKRAKRKAKT